MKKSFLMTLLCIVALSANAQIFKKQTSTSEKSESKFVKQMDMYLQDKWGVGFTLRKENSSYWGWNLISASYMSGWHEYNCPKNLSIVNARLMGIRFNVPIRGNFKFYAEGMPGYSYVYNQYKYKKYEWGYVVTKTQTNKNHCFGLDCGAGFQVHKNISIGYNYTFLATFTNTDNYHIHWGRVSILF